MTKAQGAPTHRNDFREELSQFLRASVPGRANPVWGVWWLAFIFWAVSFGVGVYIGSLRKASREADTPEDLLEVFLINTPIIANTLTFVMMYIWVRGTSRRPFFGTLGWNFEWTASGEVLGQKRVVPLASVVFGLAAAAFIVVAVSALAFIPGPETQADKLFNSSDLSKYVISASAVVVAPLLEELLYRGLLFGAFERAFDKSFAIIFSTVLFTFVHWGQSSGDLGEPNWGRILSILVLAITCSGLRAYTNRIAPAYFAHLGYNLYLAVTQVFNYDPVWLLMKKVVG
jgi:hypothetical protein